MNTKINELKLREFAIYGIITLCMFPFFSAPLALAAGIVLSLLPGQKTAIETSRISQILLQASVVLMGFGMNLSQVIETNQQGLKITVFSVATTITLGLIIGRLLKLEKKTTYLIACGTAICGGSAIAAIAPIIRAKNHQVTFALAIIFTLNAIALFLFPWIGHMLNMDQTSFGYWAAIAIHDTSSVVGAGSQYGSIALQTATAVKLTRALWVIPVAVVTSFLFKTNKSKKISIPWFILFFIVAIIVKHYSLKLYGSTQLTETFSHLSWMGHKGLIIALFFIGTSISISNFKKAGKKLLILGVSLWFIISVIAYLYVR